MKNREIYTRRSMLATLASSSLGLALLSQTERVFAQALLAPIPISTPPPPPTNGKKYYVQQGADKKNNGLSAAKPFPTLQQAADLTQPGDTVYVMNGTYSDVAPVRPGQQYPDGALVITRSGNQKAPITYRNYPGHQPVIKVPASCQNSIALLSVSYINIIGLTVEGNSASFNSTDAYNNRSVTLPKYNTNGIAIRPAAPNAAISHHIQILANTVHHCPGVGISADTADHVVIRHNITYANAWYSVYAGSGISCIRSRDVDNTTGYKTFVVQNISYQNRSYIPYHVTNALSDGNGIIIDSNKTPPKEAYYPPYKGGTFVANNLSSEK